MIGRQSDSSPAIGVHLVGQVAQKQRSVAVGLVEVTLPELLDDYFFLRGEFLGRDVEPLHTVAFEPKRRFEVFVGQRDVEIGVVVVRECVVVA